MKYRQRRRQAGRMGVGVWLVSVSVLGCTKLEPARARTTVAVEGGANSGGTSGSSGGGSAYESGGNGDGYTTVTGGVNGGGSSANEQSSCIDPVGLNGFGCYRCEPLDLSTLERACSDATCTEFDNKLRLKGMLGDGRLPSLPDPKDNANTGGTSSTGTTVSPGYADCTELSSKGAIVYVTGSSAVKPFLQLIAQQLVSSNVYIVYTPTGSCVGVDAVVNRTPMKTGASPAPAVAATYWSSVSSSGELCSLPSNGVLADIGISDVFAHSCPGFELVNIESQSVVDAHGPIQTMVFAVPSNSSMTEISAQAAYFVFGFGSDGRVYDRTGNKVIWSDEAYVLQRSSTSGTQVMIGATIGVPASKWRGVKHKTSDDIVVSLQSAAASIDLADKAIGILAADYIESKNLRATVRTLAFQDTNQPCAMYPDSSATSRDKQNVRDGHYPIWGPVHLLYRVDATGNPINVESRQSVLDILGYLSGSKALPNGVKLLDVYAQSGLIPECAMRVTRSSDGANLKPFTPTTPCSCVFEEKATGMASCKPCVVQGDCASNENCSFGYCEQ